MSERKTIQINPDLFKVTTEKNTSRKKDPVPKIKIKSTEKKQRDKTLRKNVLKMIREKQQEEYKRLFEKSVTPKKENISVSTNSVNEFNRDFNESLDFFSSIVSKHENEQNRNHEKNYENKNHNMTFKKYPNENISSVLLQPNNTIHINTHEDLSQSYTNEPNISVINKIPINTPETMELKTPAIQLPMSPKFGCLKNGTLPTYRNWYNQTHRHYPHMDSTYKTNIQNQNQNQNQNKISTFEKTNDTEPFQFLEKSPVNMQMQDRNPTEIIQKYKKTTHKIFDDNNQKKIKYLKRKKIFKRTYNVGRSKIKPQIGILVSNKTIRNRISTDAQLLRQTPIQDVRKFLIKKGFIKIGTNAPNDVLRKMYESVSLVCGEIQNHNPDNLLFNFLNDTQ